MGTLARNGLRNQAKTEKRETAGETGHKAVPIWSFRIFLIIPYFLIPYFLRRSTIHEKFHT